ncbi:MAG: hypothetical protein EOO39_11600 [Cytophagaceae bacterium]|nr:MAG: hypothetical protein EOO39_11600 [Cytophagaceae bacterium]
MPGLGVKTHAQRKSSFFFLAILFAALTLFFGGTPAHAQSSTSVNATICASSSSVTISQPVSDSVVTEPVLTIRGTVKQASQIEVMIDDVYDGVIPLGDNQAIFESQLQLSPGTHTIRLKAIDYCQTADSVATVVVTYTQPPVSSSVGNQTDTATGDSQSQGVVIQAEAKDAPESGRNLLLPAVILEPLQDILRWLNIASYDTQSSSHSQLSLPRAIAIGIGAYVLVFGMAANVVTAASTLPVLQAFPVKRRLKLTGRVFRVIGLIVILVGLFL